MSWLFLQIDEGWYIGQSVKVAQPFDDDLL